MFKQLKQVKHNLRELFKSIGEDETHGYLHGLRVLNLADLGLREYVSKKYLKIDQIMAVKYAALLHDADDNKIFPNSTNYDNARRLLEDIKFNAIDEVIDMIALVSFSKNGNSEVYTSNHTPTRYKSLHSSPELLSTYKNTNGTLHIIPKWKLIPRDADRLEALGTMGIARCIAYGCQKNRPLYTDKTPRIKTMDELIKLSVDAHFNGFNDYSTISYFIANLIPRGIMSSKLDIFINESNIRTTYIKNFCIQFGINGYMTKDDIIDIIKDDINAVNLINKYM